MGAPLHLRIAVGRAELTAAFELVHRRYVARGYIAPHPGRIVYREAFGLITSRTLVAAAPSRAVLGTLTVVGDSPLGFELEATYPDEVQSLRDEGRDPAEITCLAIRPCRDFAPTAVFFQLTRFMIHYAYWRKFDDLLTAIHPRHRRFYERHFAARPIGPCRPHAIVRNHPSIGCRIDLRTLERSASAELWDRYFAEGFPPASYLAPPMDRVDHCHFLARSGSTPRAERAGHSESRKDAA